MTIGSNAPRPTRNQKREEARAKAKALREEQVKKEKRNKWFIQGGIAVGVLAVIGIFALVISSSAPKPAVRPANMASDGVVLTGPELAPVLSDALPTGAEGIPTEYDYNDGLAHIVVYEDYLCPACKQFNDANAKQLESLVSGGAATLEIRPIGMLWQKSAGTEYSRRSANAVACVANYSPAAVWNVNETLYAAQPQEGTPGLTDDEIKKLVKSSGAENLSKIDSCIDDKTFVPWVKAATDVVVPNSGEPGKVNAASDKKAQFTGTPTIVVNGEIFTGDFTDADAFRAFITQVLGKTSEPTPTPTPAG